MTPAVLQLDEVLAGTGARGCARRSSAALGQPPDWFGHVAELGLPRVAADAAWRAARRADRVVDPWPRADDQATAAVALAVAAGVRDAAHYARGIAPAGARIRALAGIAEIAAGQGPAEATAGHGPAAAAGLAREAGAAVDEVRFPGREPEARAAVAVALAAAGLGGEAAEAAARIREPWARAEAFTAVAACLGRSASGRSGSGESGSGGSGLEGAVAAALAAATSVGNRSWRAEAQAAVAEVSCDAGQPDRAREIAVTIADPIWRAEALLAIAARSPGHAAALALFTEATRLGAAVRYPWWQSRRLARAVAALVAADPADDRPLSFARQLPDGAGVLVGAARELGRSRPDAISPDTGAAFPQVLRALDGLALDDWQRTALLAACAATRPERSAEFRALALA